MKKKYLSLIAVTGTLLLAGATSAWSAGPIRPVNQNLGIPDGVFNNLVEANCRNCHENPNIVKPGTIPTRHHLLVGAPLNPHSIAPGEPDANGNYQCLTCHSLVWNGSAYELAIFRDCLHCHQQIPGFASVHHLTQPAQEKNCKYCHGPIDNPLDGHYIPSYDPSMVTPHTGLGTGVNGQGGCAYCHDASTDPNDVPLVYSNKTTHHSTGLHLDPNTGQEDSARCALCHDTSAPSALAIRACEHCHGVNSLHNIATDSNGDGQIVPGGEDMYYGHIGNNGDCMGCHGNAATSSAAPYSGPVIPDIASLSAYAVPAGSDTTLTITGSGFTNTVNGTIELTSTVELTDANGMTIALTPAAISESSLDVVIPATLGAGNYDLRVVKGSSRSSKVGLALVPAVTIDAVTCTDGTVTVTGSGFSAYLDAVNSGTDLAMSRKIGKRKRTRTVTASCEVQSWTDTEVVADCGVCGSAVTVDSIFGDATKAMASSSGGRR